MPKVSICIPAYEQVRYLERTLDSVASQNFTDLEVLVSDDSVSDAVEELTQRMAHRFEGRLRYVRNSPSLGSPGNWNAAIHNTSGAYIKIMHHDEWFMAPDALEQMVSAMEAHGADVVVSGVHVEVESTGRRWTLMPDSSERTALEALPAKLLLANTIGPPSTLLYKRSLGLDFDPAFKYLVDVEFYIRLLQGDARFHWIPTALIGSVSDAGHNVSLDCMTADVELREYLVLLERHRASIPADAWDPFDKRIKGLFVKYGIDSSIKLREAWPEWDERHAYRIAMLRARAARSLRWIKGKTP